MLSPSTARIPPSLIVEALQPAQHAGTDRNLLTFPYSRDVASLPSLKTIRPDSYLFPFSISSQRLYRPMLLQISNDPHLAWTRQLLMEQAGFAVYTTGERGVERFQEQEKEPPMAVFLCQTVNRSEAECLSYKLQQKLHDVQLIRLTTAPERECNVYHRVLTAPVLPAELMCEISRLRTLTSDSNAVAL